MKRRLWQVAEEWDAFNHFFDDTQVVDDPMDFTPRPGDALVLWGGPDINPALYWDTAIPETDYDQDRDNLDWSCLIKAVDYNIPIIGVCRGMQMLAVYSGGGMIQDVTHHQNGNHTIEIDQCLKYPEPRILVNSLHHQMVRPFQGEFKTVGRTINCLSTHYKVGPASYEVNHMSSDPEVIVSEDLRAVGVQFHPEYTNAPQQCIDFANYLIKRFLFEDQWKTVR